MVANFSVFGGFDSNEWRIVNFADSPEDFSFARPRSAVHKDVTGSHGLLDLGVDLSHSVLVSDCLCNHSFSFSLRNDVFVQLTNQL